MMAVQAVLVALEPLRYRNNAKGTLLRVYLHPADFEALLRDDDAIACTAMTAEHVIADGVKFMPRAGTPRFKMQIEDYEPTSSD